MEIKKRKQRASYIPTGTHKKKCSVCNGWMQRQPDGTQLCVACHFRQKQKEEAERIAAGLPAAPEVRIGKI